MCKIIYVECLVKKREGDFNRALSAGFGIGQHSKNEEMRLILPTTSKQVAEEMISHHGFEKLSEVSFKD
jgi:hypothetical protein